jgi:FkbM family methyltransferase
LYVFLFGVWEPDVTAFIRRQLSEGDTFCDVGAHVGYYSLLAASCVGPSGRVVAVEASPTIFDQLQKNLAMNGLDNVRALNIAATDKVGVLNVHRGPEWNLGWSTTHAERGLPLECQVSASPVNEILTADERQTLRLIKVDVEGTERELFPGLIKVLRDSHPDAELVIEVSPRWWDGPRTTIEEALQPIVELGFHVYEVDNRYNPWRYFWSNSVRPPRRVRAPIKSWIGQTDLVLSRQDRELL